MQFNACYWWWQQVLTYTRYTCFSEMSFLVRVWGWKQLSIYPLRIDRKFKIFEINLSSLTSDSGRPLVKEDTLLRWQSFFKQPLLVQKIADKLEILSRSLVIFFYKFFFYRDDYPSKNVSWWSKHLDDRNLWISGQTFCFSRWHFYKLRAGKLLHGVGPCFWNKLITEKC